MYFRARSGDPVKIAWIRNTGGDSLLTEFRELLFRTLIRNFLKNKIEKNPCFQTTNTLNGSWSDVSNKNSKTRTPNIETEHRILPGCLLEVHRAAKQFGANLKQQKVKPSHPFKRKIRHFYSILLR
jgi:hypothetical protein